MDQSPKAQELLRKNIILNLNQLIQYIIEVGKGNADIHSEDWFERLFLQSEPIFHEEEGEGEYVTREPYEFWVVSEYFGEFLEANEELTTKEWGFYLWGRETTGQSILLDSIFQKFVAHHNDK